MGEFSVGFQYLMLILARVMGMLFIAPIYAAAGINFRMRMILAFFIAVILYPVSYSYLPTLPDGPGAFALEALGQGLIGVSIGFMITIIFTAFQLAGYIFSIQVGLSFSEVLDPQSQVSIPVFGTLKNMIGMLLFLTVDFQIDGYYVPSYLQLIRALAESFRMVPSFYYDPQFFGTIYQSLDSSLGFMFITALKIGIPVMGILFISSVTLGLMGRVAPQMNLMNMGIQLNIIVGIFVLFTLMPVLVPLMNDSFNRSYYKLGEMLDELPARRKKPAP